MISNDILQALKGYMEKLQAPVTFVVQSGEHSKKAELMAFLTQVASSSDKLGVQERDTAGALRSAMSFALEIDGELSGVEFSGIPSGHEFNSLVLAILRGAGGAEIKLDDSIQALIKAVDEPLHFEVFISLNCHNCPDVVQALDQFALINPHIRCEMIDGALYPALISEHDIQGVPSVYLNGELFANGKIDAAQLLDKLMQRPGVAKQVTTESLPVQDIAIIGGGPAGVSAAIYSARKGLAVTIIADRLGGQVKDTMGIENLISVPQTTGPELVGALQQHMHDYDITLKEHVRVAEIENTPSQKVLTLSTGEVIRSKTLIFATGARWRELGVPGEKENIGNGVAYCPHCDGPFFKGKDVAVVGGGNSGIEAALDLAGIVKSVQVYEFMPTLKADSVLVSKARAADNITINTNVAVQSIDAIDGKVTAIKYQDRESSEERSDELAGVFVQIGLLPNSQLAEGLLDITPYGEIQVDDKCRTSQPGIFACGDVTTTPYKQIVVALGEGSKASLAAFEYLLTEYQEDDVTAEIAA
ncbi:MAG: alkyl hydroperoxide reductase subunit F [Pseudomonadota bacterium]